MNNTIKNIKIKHKMQILTALFSFCIVLSFAQKKYWIGESGDWNNPKNWSDDFREHFVQVFQVYKIQLLLKVYQIFRLI